MDNLLKEIDKEEATRLYEFEKMPNIYKIVEFGKEDAFSKDPKFLEFEYHYEYRCLTDQFITTFLFFIEEGKRMIIPFVAVKLRALEEDAECEYQVDGNKDTMRWWNKTSYQAFHPSI